MQILLINGIRILDINRIISDRENKLIIHLKDKKGYNIKSIYIDDVDAIEESENK
jgi:hypothetical protein